MALMRWVLSGPDPHAGRKHITENGLTVLENLLRGFANAGFDDVVSVLVDRRAVYIDTKQQLHDLQAALEETVRCGALRDGLRDVHVVLSQRSDHLHNLAHLAVTDDVLVDESEVQIRWSTRIAALRVRGDEGALAYQQRIAAAAAQGEVDEACKAASRDAQALAKALGETMAPAQVSLDTMTTRVVVPGPRQVGRFRHLGFGKRLRPRVYRAHPKDQRVGAYDDPHVYYYFDPYHDLLSWVLVQEALAGRWQAPGVEFVHPDGRLLFRGGQQPTEPLDVPSDSVRLEENTLVIADDIPTMGFDPAEVGSPHAPGFGGDNG